MAATLYAGQAKDRVARSDAAMPVTAPAADDCDTNSCFFCTSPETD